MVLGLLPGSKPFKVRYVTPLFLRVAEILQRERPELQIVLLRSPFTPREQLQDAITNERYREATGGVVGRLEREGTWDWIVTAGGAKIQVLPPEAHQEALSVLDLALTVPGTNTAELAICGVPMVVALPLHKPEVIPLDGLMGQLGNIPLLGPAFKRFLARRFALRKPLLALPNQRAGHMVTPEMMGAFAPESLALMIEQLLMDSARRREIKLKLLAVMGPTGAAKLVVETVMELLSRRVANTPQQNTGTPHPSEPSP
jgi:lipid A disaccharide synthetase